MLLLFVTSIGRGGTGTTKAPMIVNKTGEPGADEEQSRAYPFRSRATKTVNRHLICSPIRISQRHLRNPPDHLSFGEHISVGIASPACLR